MVFLKACAWPDLLFRKDALVTLLGRKGEITVAPETRPHCFFSLSLCESG